MLQESFKAMNVALVLIPNDKEQNDIFIQSDSVNGAMHGDSVIARITKSSSQSRKSEGEIVKILSRANEKIVGVFEKVIPLAMSFQIIKNKRSHYCSC